MTKPSAGPGWYLDETDTNLERYWNGSMWSQQIRPKSSRATLISAAQAPKPAPRVESTEDQLFKLATRAAEAAERAASGVRVLVTITIVLLVLTVAGAALIAFKR